MGWASRSFLEEENQPFEVYMTHEHKSSTRDVVDPVSMSGFNFLVTVTGSTMIIPEEFRGTDDIVTLEKVWSCKGRLLGSNRDHDGRIKDICLSFALFRILLLKYAITRRNSGKGVPPDSGRTSLPWTGIRASLQGR